MLKHSSNRWILVAALCAASCGGSPAPARAPAAKGDGDGPGAACPTPSIDRYALQGVPPAGASCYAELRGDQATRYVFFDAQARPIAIWATRHSAMQAIPSFAADITYGEGQRKRFAVTHETGVGPRYLYFSYRTDAGGRLHESIRVRTDCADRGPPAAVYVNTYVAPDAGPVAPVFEQLESARVFMRDDAGALVARAMIFYRPGEQQDVRLAYVVDDTLAADPGRRVDGIVGYLRDPDGAGWLRGTELVEQRLALPSDFPARLLAYASHQGTLPHPEVLPVTYHWRAAPARPGGINGDSQPVTAYEVSACADSFFDVDRGALPAACAADAPGRQAFSVSLFALQAGAQCAASAAIASALGHCGGPLDAGRDNGYCLHRVEPLDAVSDPSLRAAYRLLHTGF